MASSIKVLVNPVREQLLHAGYGSTRISGAFQFAALRGGRYQQSNLPAGLRRQATTGILTLQPSAYRADYVENSAYVDARMGLASFVDTFTQLLEIDKTTAGNPSGHKVLALKRTDAQTAFSEVTVPTNYANFFTAAQPTVISGWLTKLKNPLRINEGWSVMLQPYGTADDRASDWAVLGFGNRWVAALDLNSQLRLYYNFSGNDWTLIQSFDGSVSGVDHTKPVVLSCIPFGPYFIEFSFTSLPKPPKATLARATSDQNPFFVVNLLDKGIIQTASKDPSTNQYTKIEPGPFLIGTRLVGYGFTFSMDLLRYPDSVNFALMPEVLDAPIEGATPTVQGFGYEGQKADTFAGAGSSTSITFVNENDSAWDDAVDTRLVTKGTLSPSADKRYSPEIWSLDTNIDPVTQDTGTEVDISTKWQLLRFKKTSAMESSPAFIRRKADYSTVLKRDAGVQLKIDNVAVWDGRIGSRRPVIEGVVQTIGGDIATTVSVTDDVECVDMWDYLERTPVGFYKSISGATLHSVLSGVLARAGVGPVTFDAIDLPIFQKLTIDGFNEPGDQKMFAEDASIASAIRALSRFYGVDKRHNFRVLWDPANAGWAVYFPKEYTSELVTRTFHLSPESLTDQTNTDEERWALNEFLIFSQLQFDSITPEYNQLTLAAPTSNNDGAMMFGCFIAPDPAILSDADNVDYEASLRPQIMPMPYSAFASSANEAERVGRNVYAEDRRMMRTLSVEGEWQPGIEVDQYWGIIGPKTDGDGSISYGAWRIDEIAIEIECDDAASMPSNLQSRRFSWKANYTLEYAGEYTADDTYEMFTEILPAA